LKYLAETSKNLGKIISIHGVQPALVQRAAIVAVLAFVFFLVMLAVFSYRQNIGYFVLASAFLVVEIFTLMGLFSHRRNVLRIFEKGLCYKKQCRGWSEIGSLKLEKAGLKLPLKDGTEITIPNTLHEFSAAVRYIQSALHETNKSNGDAK
jgi:hypothetical protein